MQRIPIVLAALYISMSMLFVRSPELNPWFISQWALFDQSIAEKTIFDVVLDTEDGPKYFTRDLSRKWQEQGRRTNPIWKVVSYRLPSVMGPEDKEIPKETLDKAKEVVFTDCRCQSFKVVRLTGSLQDYLVWRKDLPVEVLGEFTR